MADFVIREWALQPYPGDQAPPHVHFTSDEAFYVLEGQMQFLVGNEREVVPAGTLVVVPSGTAHTFATVGQTGARVLVVMTPEVAALVEALHAPDLTPAERADVWSRHNSAIVAR